MADTQTSTNIPVNSGGHLTADDYEMTTPEIPEEGITNLPGSAIGGTMNGTMDGTANGTMGSTMDGSVSGSMGGTANEMAAPAEPEDRSCPFCPDNSQVTWPVFPLIPTFPNYPSTQNYAQVRFLNASSAGYTVNISIDNTNYAINSRFGTISNYDPVTDGFHTVTVRNASGMRSIMLQQSFPFSSGQKYTMVLVDSADGGFSMVQVPSTGCNNMSYNTGCYRVANMAYPNSRFDVMLYSHNAVFRNVEFRNVTSYKQAGAGTYQFYITNANNFTVIRELPFLIIGGIVNGSLSNEPLLSYEITINSGAKYTSYIIGNPQANNLLRVLTVED